MSSLLEHRSASTPDVVKLECLWAEPSHDGREERLEGLVLLSRR